MDNKEWYHNTGTVVALGFIVLGLLNLFSFLHFNKTHINAKSALPGILFISIGIVVLIVRAIRK
jgi:hypothetical protein